MTAFALVIVCNIKFNNTHGKTPINRTPIYRKPRKNVPPILKKLSAIPFFAIPCNELAILCQIRPYIEFPASCKLATVIGSRMYPFSELIMYTSTDRVQFLLDDKPCDPIIEIMIYCSSWFTSPFSVHPNFAVKRSFPVLLYYYNLAAISIKLASKLHVLVLLIFVPSSAVRPHSCNW